MAVGRPRGNGLGIVAPVRLAWALIVTCVAEFSAEDVELNGARRIAASTDRPTAAPTDSTAGESLYPFVELPANSTSMSQVLMQTALYGYVLFNAANLIGDGAELLLLVPQYASLVGSIVVPILGAVPDGMMILCSGLGPPEEVQDAVKVGVGALAGSTIMLLTLPWFLSIITGRVSIRKDGRPNYVKDASDVENWEKLQAPTCHPTKNGVGIGDTIRKNAKLMLLTSTTYLLLQGSCFWAEHTEPGEIAQQAKMENPFAWAGLMLCTAWFIFYMVKMLRAAGEADGQVQDKIIEKTVSGIEMGHLSLRGAMAQFAHSSGAQKFLKGRLEASLLENSETKEEVRRMCKLLIPFFKNYDSNGDGQISREEFRMILKDLRENIAMDTQSRLFNIADADNSGSISFEEFVVVIMVFALDPSNKLKAKDASPPTGPREVRQETSGGGDEGDDGDEDMPADLADLPPKEQQKRIKKRAFVKMTIGTVLVLLFSDPMCDCLGLIGTKLGIKPFFVSFVLAPLASNASELVSAMRMAQKRTVKSMVNALSSLEGAAIMNNTFCLAIFLILIVWKKLVWEFSAETIAIVVVQVLIGIIAVTKRTQTVLDGVVILLCYPLSLVIVKVLEDHVGLD